MDTFDCQHRVNLDPNNKYDLIFIRALDLSDYIHDPENAHEELSFGLALCLVGLFEALGEAGWAL